MINSNRNNNNRIKYVDIFRGIGIILMVLGHIGLGDVFHHYIHAFHMPMFFFISGFCYKQKNISMYMFIKSKSFSLLLPYTVFGVIQYILWLLYKGNSLRPLINLFWINTDGIVIAGALWFLTALFCVDIIFFLIDRKIGSDTIKNILILFLSIIGYALPIMHIRLPLGADVALVGLGFYYIGFLIKTNEENKYIKHIINLNWIKILLFMTFVSLSIFNSTPVNLRTGRYGMLLIFWGNAILSIIVILNICKKLDKYGIQPINTIIEEIGKNGIVYVCINQLVITVLQELLQERLSNEILYYFIIILSVFICLYKISKIIVGTKLRVLIGKKLEN